MGNTEWNRKIIYSKRNRQKKTHTNVMCRCTKLAGRSDIEGEK